MSVDLKTVDTTELYNLVNDARDEISRRKQEAEQKERESTFTKPEAKKAIATYRKSYQKFAAAVGKTELVVNVPIKFTLETELDINDDSILFDMTNERQYSRSISGKIQGKVEGLTKKQQETLQEGVTMIINRACEMVYDLFPSHKQLEKVADAFNDAVEDMANIDENLTHGEMMGESTNG